MNVFTVSFFGHRTVADMEETEKKLSAVLQHIIENNGYVKFLFGNDGEFDWLVSSVISRVTRNRNNIYTVLVLPYMKAGYRRHKENYMLFYNEVEICEKSSSAHFKAAFQIRNRDMVDRSDLVVCCIQHRNGGAYQTVQYAVKKNIKIINIGQGGLEYE